MSENEFRPKNTSSLLDDDDDNEDYPIFVHSNESKTLGGLPSSSYHLAEVTTQIDTGPARFLDVRSNPIVGPMFEVITNPSLESSSAMNCKNKTVQESHGVSSSKGRCEKWNVTDDSVPVLPDFHPLAHTAVFVPHTPAPEVARRVCSALHDLSIATTFNTIKAKAKCVTNDNVEFRIFLYRGKKNFSHGIIVEVQRRYGFSFNFQSQVSAILDVSEGKIVSLTDSLSDDVFNTPLNEDETDAPISEPLPSLHLASELLFSDNDFDVLMGLDFLVTITDDRKMDASTAMYCSKLIIFAEDDSLRSRLLEIAQGDLNDKKRRRFPSLRTRAMSVLSNIASTLKNENFREAQGFSVGNTVAALLPDIRNASNDALTAYTATIVISSLIKAIGPENWCEKDSTLDALYSARDVAQGCHVLLEREANFCVKALL